MYLIFERLQKLKVNTRADGTGKDLVMVYFKNLYRN